MNKYYSLFLFIILAVSSQAQVWDWVYTDGTPSTNDRVEKFTKDSEGNLYVLSTANGYLGYGTGYDYIKKLFKLSPDGDIIWERYIESNQEIESVALEFSDDGLIFLAGNFTGALYYSETDSIKSMHYIECDYPQTSAFVVKYTNDGEVFDALEIGKPSNTLYGNWGHVYQTLESLFLEPNGQWTAFVNAHYDIWLCNGKRYEFMNNSPFVAVRFDAENNVVELNITSYKASSSIIKRKDRYVNLTYKHDSRKMFDLLDKTSVLFSEGTDFENTFDTNLTNVFCEDNSLVSAFEISEASLFENKEYHPVGNGGDILLVKYSADLETEWVLQLGGANHDGIEYLTVDGEGNIYIYGYFSSKTELVGVELDSKYGSFYLLKLSPEGKLLDIEQHTESHEGEFAEETGLTNEDGTRYVSGEFSDTREFYPYTETSTGYEDIYVGKMSCKPSQELWINGKDEVCVGEEVYTTAQYNEIDYKWELSGGGQLTINRDTVLVQWADTGTFELSVTPFNSCGEGIKQSISVHVKDIPQGLYLNGDDKACVGSSTYGAPLVEETTYEWSVTGNASVFEVENNAVITFPAIGDYEVSYVATNQCGSADANILPVTVQDAPSKPQLIEGSADVCEGVTAYNVPLQVDANYNWKVNGGGTIQELNEIANINWTEKGLHKIMVYAHNACGTSEAIEKYVNVHSVPEQKLSVQGDKTVCLGEEEYEVALYEGVDYQWDLSGGGIMQEDGNQAVINWGKSGNHILKVTPSNECGEGQSSSATISVAQKPVQPDSIYGLVSVCAGVQQYSIIPQVDEVYTWAVSGGGVISQNGYTAEVNWQEAGEHTISVTPQNSCGLGQAKQIQVTVKPSISQLGGISGNTEVCIGKELYSVSAVAEITYDWQISSGNEITSEANSNELSVLWKQKGLQTITLSTSDGCASQLNVLVDAKPDASGAISGDSLVCGGNSVYSVEAENGIEYAWKVDSASDFVASGNLISINWDDKGTQKITVSAFNECGSAEPSTFDVLVESRPSAPQNLSGESLVCLNKQSEYQVDPEAGVEYVWSSNSDAIVIGNSETAKCAFLQEDVYSLQVYGINSCGSSPVSVLDIEAISKPSAPTIEGDSLVCKGLSEYSVFKQKYVTYSWTLSSGGSLKTADDTVYVDWQQAGFHIVSCVGKNQCGQSDTTILRVKVIENPALPVLADGSADVCLGTSVYEVEDQLDAQFSWNLSSGGGIVPNREFASVIWNQTGAHEITVQAYNRCGISEPLQVAVSVESVPSQPAEILGEKAICLGTEVYKVENPDSAQLLWDISPSLSFEQKDDSVTINWTEAGRYTLYVKAKNSCGSSLAQAVGINVNTIPQNINSINYQDTICKGSAVIEVNTDSQYKWNLPESISLISKTSSVSKLKFSQTGNFALTVKPENECGSGTEEIINIAVKDIPQTALQINGDLEVCKSVQVYSVNAEADVEYVWNVNGSASLIQNNDSATVSWNTGGEYTIMAEQYNECGYGVSASKTVSVKIAPNTTSLIKGASQVCKGDTALYALIAENGMDYRWEMNGTEISVNKKDSLSYPFSNEGIQLLSVSAFNECGYGPVQTKQIYVSARPDAPYLIDGNTSLCAGAESKFVLFNYPGNTYSWQADEGEIVSEENNSAVVRFNSAGEHAIKTIAKNECGFSDESLISVLVKNPAKPLAGILGDSLVCKGVKPYSIEKIKGYEYNWNVSGGQNYIDNDTALSVDWTLAGIHKIIVVYNNQCGEALSDTLSVLVKDAPQSYFRIAGDVSPCRGNQVAYVTNTNDAINWSTDSSAEVSVINDTAFVTWQNSGNYILNAQAHNECGLGLAVTENIFVAGNMPVFNTVHFENDTVCLIDDYQSWIEYNSSYDYEWSVMPVAGTQFLNNGLQIWWDSAGVYSLSVKGINGCGHSDELTKTVVVENELLKPLITESNDTLYSSDTVGNQWYINGELAEEATKPWFVPQTGGEVRLSVSNSCGESQLSQPVMYIGQRNRLEDFILLYPNPVETDATIVLPINGNIHSLKIFDAAGKLLQEVPLSGTFTKTVNMEPYATGTYWFYFESDHLQGIKSVIKK